MSVTDEFLSNNAAFRAALKVCFRCRRASMSRSSPAWMRGSTWIACSGLARARRMCSATPAGSSREDTIRSLAISQRLLGTKEIIVIHHTDCGMLTFTDDGFKRAIQDETGIKPSWAAESFGDLEEEVRQSMRRIEASAFVTRQESLRGFIFDVATGKLSEVTLSTPPVGRQHDRSNRQVQSSV